VVIIFCTECGEENKDDVNYCFNCGEDLSEYPIDKGSSKSEKDKIILTEKEDLVYPIFLERMEGRSANNKSFAGYYNYRYNVDPERLLKKALENGHIIKSDFKYNMQKTTNAELKDVLKQYNLKVSGAKKELIERLLNNVDKKELKIIFDQSYYRVTESGKKIIENNEHLIYFHKSSPGAISIVNYHKKFLKNDNLDKYEVAIELLKERKRIDRERNDWSKLRGKIISLANLYEQKNDNIKALEAYLKASHLNLSGMTNNGYAPGSISIAPGIINKIKNIMNDLNYSTDDLKKLYFIAADDLDLPKTVYSKQRSFEYIIRALNEGTKAITKELMEENQETMEEIIARKQKEKLAENKQDIKNKGKHSDVEYDKDGFIKPKSKRTSVNKENKGFKYYFAKTIFILLAIIFPPVGVIVVLKSNKFSKPGKGLSVIWATIIIGVAVFGPTAEVNVTEKVEEAREKKDAGNYSSAAEYYETALNNWDEEEDYSFSNDEIKKELKTIDEEHKVEINFEIAQGEGEITPSSGAHDFYENENIEVEAIPEEGWEFKDWEIDGETVDSSETVIENLTENKTVIASFNSIEEEVVEEKEEETETAPISEESIEDYVDDLIENTIGHSTNMGYKRLLDSWTEGYNNEKLVLMLQGDENFTTGMTKGGIINNTEEIIRKLYSERDDINNLELRWYMVLIDERGNEENTEIINIEFSRSNYNSVNWDNFLTDNLPNIADDYWAHPNYR